MHSLRFAKWEPSHIDGLLVFHDGLKRWFRCCMCSYLNNRAYHSRMHYQRVHVNGGKAMVSRRKFSTYLSPHLEKISPTAVKQAKAVVNRTKPIRHDREDVAKQLEWIEQDQAAVECVSRPLLTRSSTKFRLRLLTNSSAKMRLLTSSSAKRRLLANSSAKQRQAWTARPLLTSPRRSGRIPSPINPSSLPLVGWARPFTAPAPSSATACPSDRRIFPPWSRRCVCPFFWAALPKPCCPSITVRSFTIDWARLV